MNVAHYVQVFSQPSETFIIDLIRHSESLGYSNSILTQRRMLEKERPWKQTFVLPKKQIWFRLYRKLANINDYQYQIKKLNADLIHAHFGPNGAFLNGQIKSDLPFLTSFYGTDALFHLRVDYEFRREIQEMSMRENYQFSASSIFLMQKCIELGIPEHKIHLLYCTYNPVFEKYKKSSYYDGKRELRLISVGRFVNWKGHKVLLEAFALLKKHIKNCTLTLVGEGELKESLQENCRNLGIEKSVIFTGYLKPEELAAKLVGYDIYVQPSIIDAQTFQQEAFGIAPLEAAIVGLGVVVSNSGALPEVTGDESKYAVTFETGSPTELCKKILKMCDEDLSKNNNLRGHMVDRFGPDKYRSNLKLLYDKVIS